ncbi:MAG: hypothetical protein QXX32_06145 [Thermofilum sp.]|uniref:Uncharacterized protein n=1 Tax=Thermofilum adornatum TaxID=1365176 RepID=S6A4S3_9CREN|nr:hypothetical protein [Thermofilum adornatum]AGT34427.1 hypothetical protein N186_00145 [Thermofilum adornatum]
MQSTGEKRKIPIWDAAAIIGGFVLLFLGLGLLGTYSQAELLMLLGFILVGLGIGLLVYVVEKLEGPALVLTISGEKDNKSPRMRENLWASFIIVGFGLGILFNNLLAGLILGFGLGLIADALLARAGPCNK